MIKKTEKQIETEILNVINLIEGVYAIKVNNIGVYDSKRKIYRKPVSRHQPKGVADIVGVYQGRALFIEVKTPQTKSRVSSDQLHFLNRMKKAGAVTVIATSVEDVLDVFAKECGYELPKDDRYLCDKNI